MKPKGIILAAGKGSRLYPLTLNKPKCLLEVGGRRIIDWQMDCLREIGVEDILMVVGYQKEILMAEVGSSARYRVYDGFDKTNNLHTLWSVRDELETDFFCLFADLIFEPEVLSQANDCREEFCLVVDTARVLEGTMPIRLSKDRVTQVGDQVPPGSADGNFIGVALIRQGGAKQLVREMEGLLLSHQRDYYTAGIDSLIRKGVKVSYVDVKGKFWAEVDTKEDLENAQSRVEGKQFSATL